MSNIEYHSAIYRISPYREIATRIVFNEYNCTLLPKKIEFNELANIMSKMQEICFKDENLNNENTNRIIDLFLAKKNKTIIVAISLGYLPGVTDYMDFVDGGSATVQKSKLKFLDTEQPWINEVCRSKFDKKISSGTSPVTIVMEMIEKYIKTYLMKTSKDINGLYLYVEKKPEHGNPDFLIKYYENYGFNYFHQTNILDKEDYYYMYKEIENSHLKKSINGGLKRNEKKYSMKSGLVKKRKNKTKRSFNK